MSGELKNFSRSVHDRLLNLARETERPFSELFQLYAMERFLFRLASSRHASNFVLKGGLMLRVWDAPISRPTKDVDLLGRTSNTIENLVTIVREVCAVSVVVDGMRFDSSSAVGSMIKEDADYSGIRVRFSGYLGVAKAPMQLDVGFGDATVPAPVEVEVPPLLDFPAPRLRAYRRETLIAEKLHAMTILGTTNGRMKDFYDLWLLAGSFDFDRDELCRAIEATFAARTTEIEATPLALQDEFARLPDVKQRWSAFLRKSGLAGAAPESFADVVERVREFVAPVLAHRGVRGTWSPEGPWRP